MESGLYFKCSETGPLDGSAWNEISGLPGRKLFLRGALDLTGCEVSMNRLPAGQGMPFVHAHRQNEEVYLVLAGEGTFFVDGQEFPVREGTAIRVDPDGERCWKAGDRDLVFLCIQTRQGSLEQATREDGWICPTRTAWMSAP